jgi:hypothetical protein
MHGYTDAGVWCVSRALRWSADVTALLLPDTAATPQGHTPGEQQPWTALTDNLVVANTSEIQRGHAYAFGRVDDGPQVSFTYE